MSVINKLLCCAALFLPVMGPAAEDLIKDQMYEDLDVLKHTFQVKYAPCEWKKFYCGWDLDEQIELSKEQIRNTQYITLKDFHRILTRLFNSTRDHHVKISFYSTEFSSIPIRIQSANGRYFIAWLSEAYRDLVYLPIAKGDEVLSFDDMPIDQAVNVFKAANNMDPDSPTDHALAEMNLTMRSGNRGAKVLQGYTKLGIRHADGNTANYYLPWLYDKEEIKPSFGLISNSQDNFFLPRVYSAQLTAKTPSTNGTLGTHPFFYKDMCTPIYKDYKRNILRRERALEEYVKKAKVNEAALDSPDTFIGDQYSFLPILGHVVWESKKTHHAYIYITPEGKRIGYVRVPTYSCTSIDEFIEIIKEFEDNTDALILDQLNNPGGSMFYMYGIATTLANKPLHLFKDKMTITQEEIFFAFQNKAKFESVQNDEDARNLLGEDIHGYPVDYRSVQNHLAFFNFIIQEWNEGRSLTQPGHVIGVDLLLPHPKAHYTKPILMLINHLDFSCGDFLPAILQDNRRATLLGTRTAGAGGYVLRHNFPNLFAIEEYTFTGSIAERHNSQPIENLGVSPDIVVELTERDLQMGYHDFARSVNNAVKALIE